MGLRARALIAAYAYCGGAREGGGGGEERCRGITRLEGGSSGFLLFYFFSVFLAGVEVPEVNGGSLLVGDYRVIKERDFLFFFRRGGVWF